MYDGCRGGWAPNLACSWAGASQNDEWRPLWRFWYQSTSWLHFPAAEYALPEKAIWALFNSVSHKHQLHLISLVYWRRWRQQQSGCFPHFFFLPLISAVNIGVRAARAIATGPSAICSSHRQHFCSSHAWSPQSARHLLADVSER